MLKIHLRDRFFGISMITQILGKKLWNQQCVRFSKANEEFHLYWIWISLVDCAIVAVTCLATVDVISIHVNGCYINILGKYIFFQGNEFYYKTSLSLIHTHTHTPRGQSFPILASCFECGGLGPKGCWVLTFWSSYSMWENAQCFVAERELFIAFAFCTWLRLLMNLESLHKLADDSHFA